MVNWDILDADCDEETRQAGDFGSLTSLYEVVKLAYLQPDDKILSLPRVCANAAWGRVAMALDSTLFVFGEGCSTLLMQLSLEAAIDIIIWVPQGDFLILGVSDGGIHCVHVASQRVLITKKIPLPNKIEKLFIGGGSDQSEDGGVAVTLVTAFGQVIGMKNIDPEGLSEGLRLGDQEHLSSLEAQMTVSMHKMDLNCQVTTAECLVRSSEHSWIWSCSDNGVMLWMPSSLQNPEQPVHWEVNTESPNKRVIPVLDGRYILTLDNNGKLSVICGVMGLALWEANEEDLPVLDLVFLPGDRDTAQLFLVHKARDKKGFLLRILSFPGFKEIYKLNVNENTSLVQMGEGAESVMFMETEMDPVDEEVIANLKIKSIVDGVPEARLAKLLRKRKFAEAKEFCNTFGLDIEEVHKALARHLCYCMNPWRTSVSGATLNETELSGDLTEELLEALDKIRDPKFVTSLVVEAPFQDIQKTKRILKYCKERLANTTKSEEGDQLSSLMQRVSESTYRLQTFETIFPTSDIQHWFAFSNTNTLQEFIVHLCEGNLDVASTIWHRHLYEFSSQIDHQRVLDILMSFPHNIQSSILCSWLPRNVISDLVKLCPDSMEIIAMWGDKRVKNLEVIERIFWPSNGLLLANTIISILENVVADFHAGGNIEVQMAVHEAQWKAHSPSSALYMLRQTSLALQDMQFLAEDFRVKIDFNLYTQENKETVVAALLDWLVCGEEVAPFMDGFLRTYFTRHGLDYNTTLAHYVTDTLASADQDWYVWQEAQWEDKVYAVINVITDAQVRVQSIVECIQVAPVPWSEGTNAMCKKGLALNTSLSAQLEDQRRLVSLKLVLRRYSLYPSNINSSHNAQFILRSILRRDGDTIMEDALQVVRAHKHLKQFDAYYFRALHLLSVGETDELKNLIQGIDEKLQQMLCQKIMIYVNQALLSPPLRPMCKTRRKSITKCIIALELWLKKWHKQTKSFEDDDKDIFSIIRDVDTMQAKYEIYPTITDLRSKNKSKLLEDYIEKWYANHCSNPTDQDVVPAKASHKVPSDQSLSVKQGGPKPSDIEDFLGNISPLKHLAYLMGISRDQMYFMLGRLAAKNGRFEEALKLCQMIITDTQIEDQTAVVKEVLKLAIESRQLLADCPAASQSFMSCSAMLEQNASIKCRSDLNKFILELVSSALISCHPDQLNTLLEVGSWSQLGKNLYAQCHVEGIYTQTNISESSNPYNMWKYSPVFSDTSMPIEDGLVTLVLAQAFSSWIAFQESRSGQKSFPYHDLAGKLTSCLDSAELTEKVYNLMSHLSERGHDFLTLSLSLLLSQHSVLSDAKSSPKGGASWYQQVLNILLKIIGGKKPDVTLAVSLLTLLPKKEAVRVLNELIKRFSLEYMKLQSIAIVGKELCTLNGLKELHNQFSVLYQRSTWGKRLAELSISFKEAFKDSSAVSKVLEDLVSHPECSFTLVHEYCEDFSLDITDALVLFLKTTLQSWSPNVPDEELGPGVLLQIEPPRHVFSKCQAIMAKIDNRSQLREILKEQLDELGSYNYELLELVMQQLIRLDMEPQGLQLLSRGLDIINFLRVYARQTPPRDVEIDEWVCKHPQSLGPPKISKYRLPFHELFKRNKSMMKIIEVELNITTIDIWLQAAPTLKLNVDQLCMYVTQNTVSTTLEQESSANGKGKKDTEWQVCSANIALLEKIKSAVGKIQHNELAVACSSWVVNRLPPGHDKVVAAEKCKLLAEEWKEKTSDPKAIEAYERVKIRYEQLAVEHSLHKHNLDEEKYLALTRTPVELIFALYQHPCLDSLATLSTHSMPDINSCVSDICSVAGFRQVAIQLDLLEKWLPPPESSEAGNCEETITDFKLALDPMSTSSDISHDDASLSRVIYLLRCCPQHEAVSYLLNRALSEDSSVSASHRLRALRCLLAIADEKTILKSCGKEVSSIRSFLQTITYVSRLEALGHATTVPQFNGMDKHALVEGLWRSQRHNPQALTLVIDICRDYEVTTASLWGAVLTQLTNFLKLGQVDLLTLERVLLQIKSLSHLWVVPALTTAWTTVINYPFAKASCPINDTSLSACVHSIDLLLRHCPVVIATAPLLRHCANLDLPVLALSIASADQVESHDLKAMADKIPHSKLKEMYIKLKPMLAFPRNVEDIIECLS